MLKSCSKCSLCFDSYGDKTMDIKYNDGNYKILLKEYEITIAENNIMKCKQVFLQCMSRSFDECVNKKIRRLWIHNDRGKYEYVVIKK